MIAGNCGSIQCTTGLLMKSKIRIFPAFCGGSIALLLAVLTVQQQGNVAKTQEYLEQYGTEIPLNRPVPPPNVGIVEIGTETLTTLGLGLIGALWSLYSISAKGRSELRADFVNKADHLAEKIELLQTTLDHRLDLVENRITQEDAALKVDLTVLQGMLSVIEERTGIQREALQTMQAHSDEKDNQIIHAINNLYNSLRDVENYLEKQGFEKQASNNSGFVVLPTPPSRKGK